MRSHVESQTERNTKLELMVVSSFPAVLVVKRKEVLPLKFGPCVALRLEPKPLAFWERGWWVEFTVMDEECLYYKSGKDRMNYALLLLGLRSRQHPATE